MTTVKNMVVHPEEPGYECRPGFVKGNPENNQVYLEMCLEELGLAEESKGYLRVACDLLELVAPGYNIAQMKEKFGGFRFYYGLPEGLSEERAKLFRQMVFRIEGEVRFV